MTRQVVYVALATTLCLAVSIAHGVQRGRGGGVPCAKSRLAANGLNAPTRANPKGSTQSGREGSREHPAPQPNMPLPSESRLKPRVSREPPRELRPSIAGRLKLPVSKVPPRELPPRIVDHLKRRVRKARWPVRQPPTAIRHEHLERRERLRKRPPRIAGRHKSRVHKEPSRARLPRIATRRPFRVRQEPPSVRPRPIVASRQSPCRGCGGWLRGRQETHSTIPASTASNGTVITQGPGSPRPGQRAPLGAIDLGCRFQLLRIRRCRARLLQLWRQRDLSGRQRERRRPDGGHE